MLVCPIGRVQVKSHWRLWAVISLVSVLAVELIMSGVGWMLEGSVDNEDMLVALIAAGLVIPVNLALMMRLMCTMGEIRLQEVEFQLRRAKTNLLLTMDAARMVFWELDLVSQQLTFDPARYQWLGLTSLQSIRTREHWLAQVHEDDQARVAAALAHSLSVTAEGLDVEYRMQVEPGRWVWVHSVARVVRRNDQGEAQLLSGGSMNVTDLKETEAALARSRTLLRLVSDNVPDMMWAKDLNKKYLFVNKAICEQLLFARSPEEPLGKDEAFFAERERQSHPDQVTWFSMAEPAQESDALTLQNRRATQFDEFGYVRGQLVFLHVHKAPLLDDHGAVIGVVGSARDVTAKKSTDEKLRLASLVLDKSHAAMLVTDANNLIVEVNPAFTALTGYASEEVMGQDPAFMLSRHQGADAYESMWADVQIRGHWQGELWSRRKSGEVFAEWLTIHTIYQDDGTVSRRVALFSDITEKKRAEEMIWRQANFDTLTNLPNRRMFHDRLTQGLIKAQRSGLKLAVFFLDLDNFKQVNDTLGHDMGDRLLVQAGQRIVSCVRASDTVARLGGDEFTVILADLDDIRRVENIAGKILQLLAQPFVLGEHTAYVSASIGITVCPEDATELEALMQNADQAMYAAKRSGRSRFSYYTRAMQAQAQERMNLLSDLKAALHNDQLQLYFQPIIDLKTGKTHKVEALLRWLHPVRGWVGPAEFIPLAEESGLIHAVGDWVFAQALRQSKCWSEATGQEFKISLNVSPLQLLRSNMHRIHWREQLAGSGISGQNFVIEISEGLLHHGSQAVAAQLKEFRDAGTQVAVNDFGNGCSSFAELKGHHIEYFKIEKSFVHKLVAGGDDLSLTEAVVVMAHHLGLKVIAEGVESRTQHDLLLSIGCDFAQGYWYSKPVVAIDVQAFFARDTEFHLLPESPVAV